MTIDSHIWDFLVVGLLLLGITLGSSWINRLPLSYALIYLAAGILLGPYGVGIIDLNPEENFLERLTEIVVIVSLFGCGLKMSRPLNFWAWHSTVRLIGLLMPVSIVAIALFSHYWLSFSWGAAILLGAILAPTDPVLASEVQLTHTDDRNELRFGLTSEGGLNDALAFPFVYFGLYWLEDNQWQNWFKSWVGIDLFWAIGAGIICGILVAKMITLLSRRLQQAGSMEKAMEDLVALATILLTYALTELVNGYGFLAVFVAGVVVCRSRAMNTEQKTVQLHFTDLLERLLEVGTILLLGALLRVEPILTFGGQALLIAGLLIFVVRPLGAWISTAGDNLRPTTRLLFGWFGIRGVGSLYYLYYALNKGIPSQISAQLSWIVLLTVTLSIIIHGISATPLMNSYQRRFGEENRLEPETLEVEEMEEIKEAEKSE